MPHTGVLGGGGGGGECHTVWWRGGGQFLCWSFFWSFFWVLLYIHRNRRFIRDRSPGRPPRLHTAPECWSWFHTDVNVRWYWLMIVNARWYWLMIVNARWYWLMIVNVRCYWLMIVNARWYWLLIVNARWYWLLIVNARWYWLLIVNARWYWLLIVNVRWYWLLIWMPLQGMLCYVSLCRPSSETITDLLEPVWCACHACLMLLWMMFDVAVSDVWCCREWCLMVLSVMFDVAMIDVWCLCQWCLMLPWLMFDVCVSDVWCCCCQCCDVGCCCHCCLVLLPVMFDGCCCQWCCRVYHAVCWGVPGVAASDVWWMLLSMMLQGVPCCVLGSARCCCQWCLMDVAVNDVAGCTMLCAGECQVLLPVMFDGCCYQWCCRVYHAVCWGVPGVAASDVWWMLLSVMLQGVPCCVLGSARCCCQWCLMDVAVNDVAGCTMLCAGECQVLLPVMFDGCCCQWCCRVYHAVCWGVPGVAASDVWWMLLSMMLQGVPCCVLGSARCCCQWCLMDVAVNDVAGCTMLCAGECQVLLPVMFDGCCCQWCCRVYHAVCWGVAGVAASDVWWMLLSVMLQGVPCCVLGSARCCCQWCLMDVAVNDVAGCTMLCAGECQVLLPVMFDGCCCHWCCRVYHAVCWGVPGVAASDVWWMLLSLMLQGVPCCVLGSARCCCQWCLMDVAVNDVAGCTMLCAGECQVCCRHCPSSEITMALLEPGGQWLSCLVIFLWKVGRGISKPVIVLPPPPQSSCCGNWKEGFQNLRYCPLVWSSCCGNWKEGFQNLRYCPLVWSSCCGKLEEGYQNLLLSSPPPPPPPPPQSGPLVVETGRRDFKTSVIVPSSGHLVVETGKKDIKTCCCPPVWSCGGNWKEGFLNLLLSPCLVIFLWEVGRGDIKTYVFLPLTFAPLCEDLLRFWWCLHSVRQWLPLHFINCLTSSGLFLFLLLSTCLLC